MFYMVPHLTLKKRLGEFDSLDESSSRPKKISTLRSQIDSPTQKWVFDIHMKSQVRLNK